MVDFPSTEPAPNLQVERELGLRPYWIPVRTDQILGWRKDGDSPISPVGQIRINEYVQENIGAFGDRTVSQIRILERGAWSMWRKGEDGWYSTSGGHQQPACNPSGGDLFGQGVRADEQPAAAAYQSNEPAPCAEPGRPAARLHVAALPVMYLKGWDDSDNSIALSANTAILLPTDGEVGYAEPASSAFESQQRFITELEQQMENLSISRCSTRPMPPKPPRPRH